MPSDIKERTMVDNQRAKKLKTQEDRILALTKKIPKHRLDDIENWAYLIHHIHTDKSGKETVHNCPVIDHLGNLYKIEQVKDEKGNVKHCIVGLEKNQKVFWNDEEAEKSGQKIPCANRQLGGK